MTARDSGPKLSPTERRLFNLLRRAHGLVVGHANLFYAGWPDFDWVGEFDQLHMLYVNLHRLRVKVAQDGWRVENAPGRGYRMVRHESAEIAA